FVNSRPIAVDPHVWETRPVGLDITFGVLPEPPCHTDPGLSNDQLSDLIANRSALIIHNLGGDTGYWAREGTRLEWGEQVAAENPPRYFSASRVINDRDAAPTDNLESPQPGVGVPRFPSGTDRSQAREVVPANSLFSIGNNGPDKRRGEPK